MATKTMFIHQVTTTLTSNMQLNEILKLLMLEVAFQGLQFAQSAVRSNFFGLGCPVYCHQPSLSLLLLFLLLGFLAGSALTAYLGWILAPWIFHFEPRHLSPSSTAAPRYSALSEYLNEPRGTSRCWGH